MTAARKLADADPARVDPAVPPPSSEELGPESEIAQPPPGSTEAEHYAWHLKETTSSLLLYAAMAPTLKGAGWDAYKLYRDRLLADSGNPTDPVEIMLLEQLGLAHFCMGLLAAKTANAGQVQACGVYGATAARLMAEARRTALALQSYRHANRQLGREPAREVVGMVEGPATAAKNGDEDELGERTEELDAGQSIIPYPEPVAPGEPPQRSPEAGTDHAGGARTAPRRRPGAPAVGAVHRAADRGREGAIGQEQFDRA